MPTQEEIEIFLAHHGVKGMHWGVRKARDDEKDRHASSETSPEVTAAAGAFTPETVKALAAGVEKLTPLDKAVLKSAGMSPMQAEAMKAKYGPDSNKADSGKKGLSPAQKKLIVYGAVGLGVAGLIAYGIHAENQSTISSLVDGGYEKDAAKAFLKAKPEEAKGIGGLIKSGVKRQSAEYLVESDTRKLAHSKGLTPEGLAKFSGEDLNFEPGHVFKRVSTEVEREIRPDGFFASHSDEDTERYKAVLPVYWKIWNPYNPPKSGFINHYAADTAIKVANEKTIYDTMKSSLDDVVYTDRGRETLRKYLKITTGDLSGSDEKLLSTGYYNLLGNFAVTNDPVVKHLSEKLKNAGYQGIIDSNDAGSLSAQPIKFLDGSIFKIVGHETLSASAIQEAQKSIHALAHIFATFVERVNCMANDEVDVFLAHHGIKGMHWGERNSSSRAEEHITKAKTIVKSHVKDANARAEANLALKQKIVDKRTAKVTAAHPGEKLTDEQKANIERKAEKKVTRHIAEVGAAKVAGILIGGKVIHGKLPMSVALREPRIMKIGEAAALLYLAGRSGAASIHDIHDFKAEAKTQRS